MAYVLKTAVNDVYLQYCGGRIWHDVKWSLNDVGNLKSCHPWISEASIDLTSWFISSSISYSVCSQKPTIDNLPMILSCPLNSNAKWRGNVLLLPFLDQRPAVDLAANSLLHHISPVELQARIHRLHQHSRQVSFFSVSLFSDSLPIPCNWIPCIWSLDFCSFADVRSALRRQISDTKGEEGRRSTEKRKSPNERTDSHAWGGDALKSPQAPALQGERRIEPGNMNLIVEGHNESGARRMLTTFSTKD